MKRKNSLIFLVFLFSICVVSNNALAALRDPFSFRNKSQEKVLDCKDKISLDFVDVKLKTLLHLLAKCKSANMLISDQVKGDISLQLYNLKWNDALDAVLTMANLRKYVSRNIIFIVPKNRLTKQDMQITSSLGIPQLVKLHYAKAATIVNSIREAKLLSSGGYLGIHERTNSIWIRDDANNRNKIINFIHTLDIPTRQVLINAHIVSIDKNYLQNLGLTFNTVKALSDKSLINVNKADHSGEFNFALAKLPNQEMLSMQLNAIETKGYGKILANPRLMTANHQPASIESGEEIPYQEKTSSGATSVTFKKAVLSLKVTPEITPKNKVLLYLTVNQDTLSAVTINGVPAIHTQEIKTQILLNNGETAVLGGIYELKKQRVIHKLPILGSVPILGRLFRSKEVREDTRELLIFITPQIMGLTSKA